MVAHLYCGDVWNITPLIIKRLLYSSLKNHTKAFMFFILPITAKLSFVYSPELSHQVIKIKYSNSLILLFWPQPTTMLFSSFSIFATKVGH